MPLTLPPQEIIDASVARVTRVTRRVDIYQADRTTLWKANVPFTDGNVNVSHERDERRQMNLTLVDIDGTLKPNPSGLWYDKVFKVYRGINAEGITWERKLGEFMVDTIERPHFPNTVSVSGRDFTKKLKQAKLVGTVIYGPTDTIEGAISSIASGGGIPPGYQDLPVTGKALNNEFHFERGEERWKMIHDIAIAHGYEAYLRWDGMLAMRPFSDPYAGASEYTFKTGTGGNLMSFTKLQNDGRIYNEIAIYGENKSGGNVVPVRGYATNHGATSPTRIGLIGRRTFIHDNAFVTTEAVAQALAENMLKVMALEQFNVTLQALVIPWLEEGVVVTFTDPNPAAGDPTKYLLSEFTIPLGLAPMEANVRRIVNIVPSTTP